VKVKFQAPSSSQANTVFNAKDGELTISPIFSSDAGSKIVGHFTVIGKSGHEKLFTVRVSGKSGRLSVKEVVPVDSYFDSLTPEEENSSE
jgi:hypothetical protein